MGHVQNDPPRKRRKRVRNQLWWRRHLPTELTRQYVYGSCSRGCRDFAVLMSMTHTWQPCAQGRDPRWGGGKTTHTRTPWYPRTWTLRWWPCTAASPPSAATGTESAAGRSRSQRKTAAPVGIGQRKNNYHIESKERLYSLSFPSFGGR